MKKNPNTNKKAARRAEPNTTRKVVNSWKEGDICYVPVLKVLHDGTVFQCYVRRATVLWSTELGSGPVIVLRSKKRAETYPGIARAMAEQWG